MRGADDAPFARFGLSTQVTWEPGLEITPAISPDGKMVAYSAGNGTTSKIFVRPVVGGRVTPLTDDTIAVESFPSGRETAAASCTSRMARCSARHRAAGLRGRKCREARRRRQRDLVARRKKIAYAVGDSLFIHEAGGTSRRRRDVLSSRVCARGDCAT